MSYELLIGITIFLCVFTTVFVFWAFINDYNNGFFDKKKKD